MGLLKRIKSEILRRSAQMGYPILPQWRLNKYEQSTHLRSLFDLLQIDCVLDVGANVGQFKEFGRQHVGYEGLVVSFEPVSAMYAQLLEQSRQDPRWTVRQFALGDVEGHGRINVVQEHTLTSFLPRDEAGLRAMGYQKYLRETTLDHVETVPVRRLDAIFDEVVPAESRVFLKSDTQGFDMNVVRGARGCLERISALQVELSVRHVYEGAPSYLDAIAELTALGFEVTGLYPVQRDYSLRIVNLDCTMVRASEAERLRAARNE